MIRSAILLLFLATLNACGTQPDLGDAPSNAAAERAPFPRIAPLDSVLEPDLAAATDREDLANLSLEARAERLRARAAILRQPLTDDAALDRVRAAARR
ncbi:MAG: hypothetical protein AAFR35_11365 [Pseudomonadota bacterium]